jgi:ABC-2 type transport system ATP-binding protein
LVHPDKIATARALNPIHERQRIGRSILLFEGLDQQELEALGEVRTPSLADLFVAIMSISTGRPQGATQ